MHEIEFNNKIIRTTIPLNSIDFTDNEKEFQQITTPNINNNGNKIKSHLSTLMPFLSIAPNKQIYFNQHVSYKEFNQKLSNISKIFNLNRFFFLKLIKYL